MFKRKPRNEEGFTLVEILVAVGLFVVLTAAVTATAISITNSANKFLSTSDTTNHAADTINTITRDISATNSIVVAENYYLQVVTQENNQNFDVTFFYWNPTNDNEVQVPNGIASADLPNYPAIMMVRKELGGANPTLSILAENYDANIQTIPLFTYFDINNQEMVTPVTGNDLNSIKRIDFGFGLQAKDSNKLIEMHSSANPRFSSTNIVNGGTSSFIDNCIPPTLTGTLPVNTTTATISWSEVPSANTYTIYRSNIKQDVSPKVVKVINDSLVTSWTDPDIQAGEIYNYFLITGCQVGKSVQTSTVSMTATPAQTAIANINSTKTNFTSTLTTATEVGTESPLQGSRYTAASALTNQIVWHKVNGAKGYRIYRDGTQIADIAWDANNYITDTARSYGGAYTYTVVAYNLVNGSTGGDAPTSLGTTLYSPPSAPTIVITANDADTSEGATTFNNVNITGMSGAKVTAYRVYRYVSDLTNTTSCPTSTTSYTLITTVSRTITGVLVSDTGQAWGKTYCYKVIPYNDAGVGAYAIAAIMRPPGAVGAVSFSQTDSRFYISNQMVSSSGPNAGTAWWGSWGGPTTNISVSYASVYGASQYIVSKNKVSIVGGQQDGTNTSITTSGLGVSWNNVTPGTPYSFNITAQAANGMSRTGTSTTYITNPDAPQRIDSFIQNQWGNSQTRRRVEISSTTANGNSTTHYGHTYYFADGYGSAPTYSQSRGAGNFSAYSATSSNSGDAQMDIWDNYTYGGSTKTSPYWSFQGWTNPGGNSGDGCQWTPCDIPEQYPNYFMGQHGWATLG